MKKSAKASKPPSKTSSKSPSKSSSKTSSKTSSKGTSTKPSARTAPKKASKPGEPKSGSKKPRLLSGGNPQIAKADGDAPVQEYIAAIPGWKREVGRRLDALISEAVPGVRKGVRWNSPMYGIEGQGWFASFHVFTNYVKLTFFKGTSLKPAPTGGTADEARWVDIREGDLDESRLTDWVRQASAIPGWGGS